MPEGHSTVEITMVGESGQGRNNFQSKKRNGNNGLKWIIGGSVIAGLLLIGGITALVVFLTRGSDSNNSTEPTQGTKAVSVQNANDAFSIPNGITIKPPLLNNGLTEQFLNTHKVAPKEKSHAFVLLLHWDEQNKELWTALHRRKYSKGNPLGHPGGGVDRGETMVEGAAREVREEAMNGQPVQPEHLHLLTANEKKPGSKDYFALYALFLKDKDMVTGPDRKNTHELFKDDKNGFSSPTRMKWMKLKGKMLQDVPKGVKLWSFLKGALQSMDFQLST